MKNRFKKISATLLLMAGLSIVLVGCGTEADSGGMRSSTTTQGIFS